jgi:myo-inositol-1(or 4)-monophosphatase
VSSHDTERRRADLDRIEKALEEAARIATSFTPDELNTKQKGGRGPVTAADQAVNDLLLETLPGPDEGWLSEETADEPSRLDRQRVWVVDPIDGTQEFVEGIPEWCISIGLVEDGRAVAGGICNPAVGEFFLGSVETGISLNGEALPVPVRRKGNEPLVLASRSEVKRGEWAAYENKGFTVRPMGSVAYKLARVAAGLADATWTLVPKHEWDVVAGVALVSAGGGTVRTLDGSEPVFNRRKPKLSGLLAFGPGQAYLFEKSDTPA